MQMMSMLCKTRISRKCKGPDMPIKSSATRYGSVAITVHWLSAAAILALLVLGFRAASMDDAAAKAALLRVHVPLGVFILALTVLRLAWWMVDRKPRLAGIAPWQAATARVVHALLYATIVAMGASGIGMIVLSGAGPILFGGAPRALPTFSAYAPHVPHALGAFVLLGLLAVHVGAALYHQVVRRDRLLARMGIGRVQA